jgi:hypothetical protein
MLSLRPVGASPICAAGKEKARRSRGRGSEMGAIMSGGTRGVSDGRPEDELACLGDGE